MISQVLQSSTLHITMTMKIVNNIITALDRDKNKAVQPSLCILLSHLTQWTLFFSCKVELAEHAAGCSSKFTFNGPRCSSKICSWPAFSFWNNLGVNTIMPTDWSLSSGLCQMQIKLNNVFQYRDKLLIWFRSLSKLYYVMGKKKKYGFLPQISWCVILLEILSLSNTTLTILCRNSDWS